MVEIPKHSLEKNNLKDIIARAARESEFLKIRRESSIYRRVVGFFVSKGLLIAPSIKPNATVKLDLSEVLALGNEVEPRILEVLPAALVAFPKTFLRQEILPFELKEVVTAIKNGRDLGGSYLGIERSAMIEHAKNKIKDGRVKPYSERRVQKTFRITPAACEKLSQLARTQNTTDAKLLEFLIAKA